MKKIILSTTLIILTTYGLYAQDVKFGFRGGMNLPNLMTAGSSVSPLSEGYKSRTAMGWGLFTELQLNRTVSLRFGVEYSGMGGKKDGMQPMPTQRLITEMGSSMGLMITPEQQQALGALAMNMPQYYYANVNNTAKLDYVMLPVLPQLGWDVGQSPWRVYVNAGPFVSFLLSGTQATKGTSRFYSDASGATTLWADFARKNPALVPLVQSQFPQIESVMNDERTFGDTKITGELRSSNFGVIGNVGIRYQYGRNYLFLEAGGNYGFFTVQQNEANGSNRTGAASLMIGYAFSLF
jgi:hypothetical protein